MIIKNYKMNRRPIPIKNIGGRIEQLPRDIQNIIEPMTQREYLRLRKLAEIIARQMISYIYNPKFVNYDIAIDDTFNFLASELGFNLDHYLENKTSDKTEKLRIDAYEIFEIIDIRQLINIFYPTLDWDQVISYITKDIFLKDSIRRYIFSLFKDAGYTGRNLTEIISDYNQKLGFTDDSDEDIE